MLMHMRTTYRGDLSGAEWPRADRQGYHFPIQESVSLCGPSARSGLLYLCS